MEFVDNYIMLSVIVISFDGKFLGHAKLTHSVFILTSRCRSYFTANVSASIKHRFIIVSQNLPTQGENVPYMSKSQTYARLFVCNSPKPYSK